MNLTTDQQNSSLGKILIPGTYSIVAAGGVTTSGQANPPSGLYFSAGSVPSSAWFGNNTWAELSNLSYVKFVPSVPLSSTLGAGCSLSIKFSSSAASSGELALYCLNSTGTTSIVTWVGSAVSNPATYITSGWATTNNGDVVFLNPSSTGINSAKTLSGATQAMLVFRNASTSTSGVTIDKMYFYEPVSKPPSGTVASWTSTTSSVSYTVTTTGHSGAAGRAGVLAIEVPTLSGWTYPTTIIPGVSGQTSYTFTLTGLPSAYLMPPLNVIDGYGNVGYIIPASGNIKTQMKTSVSSSMSLANGLRTVNMDITLYDTEASLPHILKLHSRILRSTAVSASSGIAYTKVLSAEDNLNIEAATTHRFTETFSASEGRFWKIDLVASKTVSGHDLYFPCTFTFNWPDNYGPTVMEQSAVGLESCVFYTTSASDSGGIKSYLLKQQINGGSFTTAALKNYSEPYPLSTVITCALSAAPGTTVAFFAVIKDQSNNMTQTPTVSAVALDGTYDRGGNDPVYKVPELKIELCEDLKIRLRWGDWRSYMGNIPLKRFEIYRKVSQQADYPTTPIGIKDPDALEFLDSSITSVGAYDYAVVGINQAGTRKALGGTAYILDNPTPVITPFVEPYLAMFPGWTAAPAKTHTTEKLI